MDVNITKSKLRVIDFLKSNIVYRRRPNKTPISSAFVKNLNLADICYAPGAPNDSVRAASAKLRQLAITNRPRIVVSFEGWLPSF